MAKKNQPIEYRLLVRFSYDERQKKTGILFLLETVMQFTNFSYFIDVKDSINQRELQWTLHGLRAPSKNMPSTGTARFQKVYFNLPKSVRFTLVKTGTVKAETELSFSGTSVASSKSASAFLKIYTDEQAYEKNRVSDVIIAEPKPDLHREQPVVAKQLFQKKK
jgi:hypothetical protein